MSPVSARIGVIGGSGLYQMEGLEAVEQVSMDTPFGKPSDVITIGMLSGVPVAFLPRHGVGHRIMPTHVPVRANVYALKELGVEWLISISAVGCSSLLGTRWPVFRAIEHRFIRRAHLNEFFWRSPGIGMSGSGALPIRTLDRFDIRVDINTQDQVWLYRIRRRHEMT